MALQTPSRWATSATRSNRPRPPHRTARSSVVDVVATRGAVPGEGQDVDGIAHHEQTLAAAGDDYRFAGVLGILAVGQ